MKNENELFDYSDIEENEIDDYEYTTTYQLESYGTDFDVNGLVRRQNSQSIYLPNFQRKYVWNKKQASKFIESLLLGLPIPSVCLYKEEDNRLIIIDGFQRLETIRLFYSGEFSDKTPFDLISVDKSLERKNFKLLSEDLKRKLDDTTIHATIVKAEEPKEQNYNAVYLIFERLNTGGLKLTPQEIRNCIYHGEFRNVLNELSNNENFKNLLNISDKRSKNQEIVLRLFALFDDYEYYTGNMKEFLNDYMNKNKLLDKNSFFKNIKIFEETFEILSNLDSAIFKPKDVLNIAIVDAVFVGTAKNLNLLKKFNSYDLYVKSIKELIETTKFQKAIETGKTHHSTLVKERISMSIDAISKLKV